jgi:hypothetical protein
MAKADRSSSSGRTSPGHPATAHRCRKRASPSGFGTLTLVASGFLWLAILQAALVAVLAILYFRLFQGS